MPRVARICEHAVLGVVFRYANGRCRQCARVRAASWNKTNPDAVERRRRKWVAANPEQARASRAKWKAENPERVLEQSRKDGRRAKGIVWAPGQSFESLWVAQSGCCGNGKCKRDFSRLPTKFVHVDHDHSICDGSPNVRGLLCFWCNTAAGKLGENPSVCHGLGDYLEAAKHGLEKHV